MNAIENTPLFNEQGYTCTGIIPLILSHFLLAYTSLLLRGKTSVDIVDVFFLCAHHKAKDKCMWQALTLTDLYIY